MKPNNDFDMRLTFCLQNGDEIVLEGLTDVSATLQYRTNEELCVVNQDLNLDCIKSLEKMFKTVRIYLEEQENEENN